MTPLCHFPNVPSIHHACVFPCDQGQCHSTTKKGSRCTKMSDFVDLNDTYQCHVHLSKEQRKVQLYDFVLMQNNQFEYKFIRNTTMEQETQADVQETCPICMSTIRTNTSVVLETCGHRFHEHCITEWIYTQHKNSCPCCRATVFHKDYYAENEEDDDEEYYNDDLYSVMDVLESSEAREYVREHSFFIQRAYTYDGAVSIAMALTLTI